MFYFKVVKFFQIDEKSENNLDIFVEKLNNLNFNENNNLTKYNTNEDYIIDDTIGFPSIGYSDKLFSIFNN